MGSTHEEEVRLYRSLCTAFRGDPPATLALALVRAVRGWKPGGLSLERYVAMQVRNYESIARQSEWKDRGRMKGAARPVARRTREADIWLDLSEDARAVARALIAARDAADPRSVGPLLDAIKAELFGVLGFGRFKAAVEEITSYLGVA